MGPPRRPLLPHHAVPLGLASNQQADVPLSAFLVAGPAALRRGRGRRPHVPARGLRGRHGAWTKNEGMLYAALFARSLLDSAAARRRRFARRLPLSARSRGFKLTVQPPNDLSATPPGRHVARASIRAGGETLVCPRAGVRLLPVLRLWRWPSCGDPLRSSRLGAGRRISARLAACAVYVPIYVLQPHPDWFFRASVDRVVIQLWPAVILATLAALTEATRGRRRRRDRASDPARGQREPQRVHDLGVVDARRGTARRRARRRAWRGRPARRGSRSAARSRSRGEEEPAEREQARAAPARRGWRATGCGPTSA